MSIITTFENQCRALASTVSPDENASRFLVGTQSPVIENLLHLFEYKDDNNNLAKISFKFPYGEIWHISTSSKHPNLMTGVIGQKDKLSVSLFKLPQELDNPIEDDYGLSDSVIDKSFDLISDGSKSITRLCHWHPDEGDQLMTCDRGVIEFWDINTQHKMREFSITKGIEKSAALDRTTKDAKLVADLRWSSLFNCSVVAAAIGPRVYGIDTRIPETSLSSFCWLIEDPKCNRVQSVDFNPNSQYYLASGGNNCQANFWDLRKVTNPVVNLKAHSHWIWSIRYNPFHDQLVLSAGSDARVVLMRAQTIASEPFGQIADDEEEDAKLGTSQASDENEIKLENDMNESTQTMDDKTVSAIDVVDKAKEHKKFDDEVIKVYEEHDDSVYAAEWAVDPWIFASLGYESRLVINKVPKEEKFSILF